MIKKIIKYSLIISIITSLYFIKEIRKNTNKINIAILAFILQVLHDFMRIISIIILLTTIKTKDVKYLIITNILFCITIIPFCHYKRCILTIWYNNILKLDTCNRYYSIYERLLNIFHNKQNECKLDKCNIAFKWLESSIILYIILLIANIYIYINLDK